MDTSRTLAAKRQARGPSMRLQLDAAAAAVTIAFGTSTGIGKNNTGLTRSRLLSPASRRGLRSCHVGQMLGRGVGATVTFGGLCDLGLHSQAPGDLPAPPGEVRYFVLFALPCPVLLVWLTRFRVIINLVCVTVTVTV